MSLLPFDQSRLTFLHGAKINYAQWIECIYLVYFVGTECSIGWHGANCQGHCRNGTTCNHVTGLCDKGCDTGWTGVQCDKGFVDR